MTVTPRDETDGLIGRLEAVSRQRPRWHLFRTAGLVLLAYGYLGLVLGGSLAPSLLILGTMIYAPNAVTLKFGLLGLILLGGLAWAAARGLGVRLEPPDGLPVQWPDAPKLLSLLDELRAALNCRRDPGPQNRGASPSGARQRGDRAA